MKTEYTSDDGKVRSFSAEEVLRYEMEQDGLFALPWTPCENGLIDKRGQRVPVYATVGFRRDLGTLVNLLPRASKLMANEPCDGRIHREARAQWLTEYYALAGQPQ